MLNYFRSLFANPVVKTICRVLRQHPEMFSYSKGVAEPVEQGTDEVAQVVVTVIAHNSGLFQVVKVEFEDKPPTITIVSDSGVPMMLNTPEAKLLMSAMDRYLALPQDNSVGMEGQTQ